MIDLATQSFLGSCPTEEEIAVFLDGMVAAGERRRILAHLARCESCYEVFAGAARALS
jgi:predicted anti-sigma-YlaC factor YlaD